MTRQSKTPYNVHNSYISSFTMKHDGFHLDFLATSLVHNGINHSTKSCKFTSYDDPSYWHLSAMKLKCHQCEEMVRHISGAKCGIDTNNLIII